MKQIYKIDEGIHQTTSSRDWLDMDLKSQSGAIWIENNSKLENNTMKPRKFKSPNFSIQILKPEMVKYGDKDFQQDAPIIN